MCIHKFYIFINCGHSFFTPGPLTPCSSATFHPLPPSQHYRLSQKSGILTHAPFSSTCTPVAHPYRTIRLAEGLCLKCELRRNYLLAQAEQDFLTEIKFHESKWRVQYQSEPKRGTGNKWQNWDEEDLSVEMLVKQRQRDRSGRVGFSADNVKTPDMANLEKPPPPPPPKGPAKKNKKSSTH